MWTPCTLGGRRPWFRCEVCSNRGCCSRRVAVLYSAGELFACRQCHQLAMQARTRRRSFAASGGPGRSGCVWVPASASPSHFLRSRQECTGEPTYGCERLPASRSRDMTNPDVHGVPGEDRRAAGSPHKAAAKVDGRGFRAGPRAAKKIGRPSPQGQTCSPDCDRLYSGREGDYSAAEM